MKGRCISATANGSGLAKSYRTQPSESFTMFQARRSFIEPKEQKKDSGRKEHSLRAERFELSRFPTADRFWQLCS